MHNTLSHSVKILASSGQLWLHCVHIPAFLMRLISVLRNMHTQSQGFPCHCLERVFLGMIDFDFGFHALISWLAQTLQISNTRAAVQVCVCKFHFHPG
jgi:hypothetical protein